MNKPIFPAARRLIAGLLCVLASAACQAAGDGPRDAASHIGRPAGAPVQLAAAAGDDQPTEGRRRQPRRRTGSERDYIGAWIGVEGTLLHVERGPDGKLFVVNFWSLEEADRGTFDAEVAADGLRWTRNGEPVVARFGSGAETGLKWLDGKKRCLVVTEGEGYCRD